MTLFCCCTTWLHTLFCLETPFLRFSIHGHVNWAPYREISSLLVLGEACPCSTGYTGRLSSHPSTPNQHTTMQKAYMPLKQNKRFTVLYIDLWTVVPVEPSSDTIVTGKAIFKQSWTFGHSLRTRKGARQRLLSVPQCLQLSPYAYRAGLRCHWIDDTRAERKISAISVADKASDFGFLVSCYFRCLALWKRSGECALQNWGIPFKVHHQLRYKSE